MDPVELKLEFNRTKILREEMEGELEKTVKERRTSPNITKDCLEKIETVISLYEKLLKQIKEKLVLLYWHAIVDGIDVDNSRLLKVFQLFYSKAADIQHLLRCINLPRGSTSIWGIVILTALIYLWATV